jgi:hypothetical protein
MQAHEVLQNYFNQGYKPILLHHNTKIPIHKKWNKKYDFNYFYNYSLAHPTDYNFGILLGDVIDVEGDTEKANEYLKNLCGEIKHPSYKSSKSIHHIFRNPGINLTRIVHNGIEFRAHKHQSVIPPSLHEDGSPYIWISCNNMSLAEIPLLPANLERILLNRLGLDEKIRYGNVKVYCAKCKKSFFLNEKHFNFELKIFKKNGFPWMCKLHRPFKPRELNQS